MVVSQLSRRIAAERVRARAFGYEQHIRELAATTAIRLFAAAAAQDWPADCPHCRHEMRSCRSSPGRRDVSIQRRPVRLGTSRRFHHSRKTQEAQTESGDPHAAGEPADSALTTGRPTACSGRAWDFSDVPVHADHAESGEPGRSYTANHHRTCEVVSNFSRSPNKPRAFDRYILRFIYNAAGTCAW